MKPMSALRAWLITDPLIALATIFFATISMIVSLFDNAGRRQAAVARAWSRVLLAVSGVKVRVEGGEKISPDGSYVFASNHASYMDTPAALANIPVQFRFMAKKGLFSIPFLGWHLARAGHIPVFRDNPRAAVKTLGLAAEAIQKHGISLIVFPEGGRTRTGELRDFKDGAAYIAIRAGVPIVPMALRGSRAVLPFGSGTPRRGVIEMRIGDPIPTAGLKLHDRTRITQQVRDRVVELLQEEPIHA
jgi:1-acyl-sn-glycerol-3-phosphate acyltransferase